MYSCIRKKEKTLSSYWSNQCRSMHTTKVTWLALKSLVCNRRGTFVNLSASAHKAMTFIQIVQDHYRIGSVLSGNISMTQLSAQKVLLP